MNAHTQTLTDRRFLPDRREAPTSVFDLLRGYRRRGVCRRQEDAGRGYLDRLRPEVVAISLAIVVLSALDALFTLLHLQGGGVFEANPVMRLAIGEGVSFFLLVKGLLTIGGVFFLALHQNYRGSIVALMFCGVGYFALTAYHVGLFVGIV